MEDEELAHLNNFCADLVGLKQWEAFPVHLLRDKRTAEWIRVRELCLQNGLDVGDLKLDLFAAWLPEPTGDEDYALILFYDEESMWTMAARYNRQRLREGVPRIAGETERCHAPEPCRPAHSGQLGGL
jgi:hypothetical protein